MVMYNIILADMCGNNEYCVGRQYSILYWEIYVAISNIVLGELLGNIKY